VQTLLGVVTGAKPDKRGEPVAWVKPLFDVTDSWREADPEEYPTRGYLFWPQANDAVRDALVFVHPRENSVRMPGVKDDYMVADPHPAIEVIDFRTMGDLEHVRAALTDGVKLSGVHVGRVLLWCDGNTCVGPVGLVSNPTGTTLEKSNRHRIPTFRLKSEDIKAVSYEVANRYVLSKTTLGGPDGYVDWDDDRQLVKRAIEYSIEAARRSGSTVDRAKQLVDETLERLDGRTSPADLRLELYRLERAAPLLENVVQSKESAASLLNSLRELPVIKQELDQVKLEERALIRSQMENALKTERDELANVNAEREIALSALNATMAQIRQREEDAKNTARAFDEQIRKAIADAVNSAPALLSQVALLKPFLEGGRERRELPEKSQSRKRSVYAHTTWKLGPTPLTALKDLRPRMLASFKAAGTPVPTWPRLHAAFAAKLFPVVIGPRAVDALAAYAQVAASGRIALVQVTGALSEPGDIFGRLDPATRSFIPHPAGLIDIVGAAKESTGLMLVVLDGANRAATETYLLPLVRAMQGRTWSIPLFHPSAIDADDPYRVYARIDWPKNLLLAATLVEGPTSLPFAPDLWAHSVLVQTEDDSVSAGAGQKYAELSEIDPASSLLLAGAPTDSASDEWFEEILKTNSGREVATRYQHALKLVQNDSAALQRDLLNAVVIPTLASIPDDGHRSAAVNEVKKALGSKNNTGLADAVEAARRRIG